MHRFNILLVATSCAFLAGLAFYPVCANGQDTAGNKAEQGKAVKREGVQKPAIDTAAKLERAAEKAREAVVAFALYEAFVAHPEIAANEKKLAEQRLDFWKDAAEKRLVRVGAKWISAAEKEDLAHQAKLLVKNAWDLVGIGNDDAAREKLVLASRTFPDAIEADFTLGLLNALVARHAATAEKHFSVCVQRMPNHVSALNNLALAEVRRKKYSEALGHWRTALQIAPGTNEIAHNIGRVLRFSGTSVIRVPKDVEAALSDLYVKSTALPGVSKSDENIGWLYMPLFTFDDSFIAPDDVPDEELLPRRRDTPKVAKRVVVGSTTGIVVSQGIVITTSRNAENAAGFQIIHPETLQRLPATLVAISKVDNLAILRCPKLVAPPLALVDAHPRLGTDIVVLGYARDGQGVTLRATRGGISSAIGTGVRSYLIDAALKPGFDGGPVLDDTGSMVGIIAPLALEPRANEATVVSSKHIIEFVRPLIKDVAVADADKAKSIKWQDVTAVGSKSAVLVLAERKPINIAMKNISTDRVGRRESSSYEENWCIRCYGTDLAECPRVGCALGKVLVPRREDGQFKNVREACPTCRGRGKVSCPICSSGVQR